MHAQVLLCNAPNDDALAQELERHLAPLIDTHQIELWSERRIVPGALRQAEIDQHLEHSDLFLVLLSADLLADTQRMALARRALAGKTRVLPILLRPCLWQSGALAALQPLPSGGTPVTSWPRPDEAWLTVVQGIQSLLSLAFPPLLTKAALESVPVPVSGHHTQEITEHRLLFTWIHLAGLNWRRWRRWHMAGLAACVSAAALIWVCASSLLSPPPTPVGMIYLPGSTFLAGSTQDEIDKATRSCEEQIKACVREVIACEGLLHAVHIAPFFLDVHEVTNKEFASWINRDRRLRVVDSMVFDSGDLPVAEVLAGHGGLITLPDGIDVKRDYEQRPAVGITWKGARLYCEDQGKRLPSETEWEYAARGFEHRLYPYGDREPMCEGVRFGAGPQSDEKGGPCERRERGPVPVGPERPEAGGLHRLIHGARALMSGRPRATWDVTPEGIWDLTGNVAEWVVDQYVPRCPERISLTGADSHVIRVVRGGDWFSGAVFARAASRRPFQETEAADHIGFRCARSAGKRP